MKDFKKIILTLLVLLIMVPNVTFASQGFSELEIELIYSENQDKDISDYFSFNTDSEVNEKVSFRVRNSSDEDIDLDIQFLNAYTSANGNIEYLEQASTTSTSTDIKYELSQYIKGPNKLTVKPNVTEYVEFELNIPQMKGVGLGAISFKINDGEDNDDDTISIKNEVKKTFSIVVNSSEEKEEIETDEPYVEPIADYYIVRLPIENKYPTLIQNANVKYELKSNGNSIFSDERNVSFVPKAKTHLNLPLMDLVLKENQTYVLSGCFEHTDKDCFEYEIFLGSREDAIKNAKKQKKMNIKPPKKVMMNNVIFKIFIGILSSSLIAIAYVILKNNKTNKKNKR